MSLVAYDSSGSEDSDKEESSTQKTQRKLLPVLSTPTGMRKRQSGPVKICLPTLVSALVWFNSGFTLKTEEERLNMSGS